MKPLQILLTTLSAIFFLQCQEVEGPKVLVEKKIATQPEVMVLGIAQDAGYPQINCKKECCEKVWSGNRQGEKVSCLGILDPQTNQYWLVDATPDIKFQLQQLQAKMPNGQLAGILLTHAHMGHYTGLMELGREAWGAKAIAVYAMPRMVTFLKNNGPWKQLVDLKNIDLVPLAADSSVELSKRITIKPFLVPHRDEYSETVGYQIIGSKKSALFIPDIDKWTKWNRNINELVQENDIAFLDGTFYQADELPGRNMNEIPHPFVVESLDQFKTLPPKDQQKIFFIHFNHSNPLLWSEQAKSQIETLNFNLAYDAFSLNI